MEGLDWWLNSTPFDSMSGVPSGPPRWERRGGMLRQPNRMVEMVRFFRAAYGKLVNRQRQLEDAKLAEKQTRKATKASRYR